jgi:DNA-binding NtrC family response regulator
VSATNRDLEAAIEARTFRDDLYYRLNIIDMRVPPLREHPDDIPELLDYWIEHFSASYRVVRPVLSAEALEALCLYRWPGNVRELRNAVERVVSRGLTHEVTISDLAPEIAGLREVAKAPGQPAAAPSRADALYSEMVDHGQSFWSVVYEPFASHDLTRADLRAIVSRGLEQTFGSYRVLVELFNMQPGDYKRFLALLHKHHCHMPYQQFRTAAPIRMTPAQIKARRPASPKILSA